MNEITIPFSDFEAAGLAEEMSSKVIRRHGPMAVIGFGDFLHFCTRVGVPPPTTLIDFSGQRAMPSLLQTAPPPHWGAVGWARLFTAATPGRSLFNEVLASLPELCDCMDHAKAYISRVNPRLSPASWFDDLYDFKRSVCESLAQPSIDREAARVRWGRMASPHRAMIVGNWYGDGILPNSRASMIAACRRWGIAFIELTSALLPGTDAFAEKLELEKHASGFDQVIYLDRDVVIRSDSPNPMDLVPVYQFGAVPSYQPDHDWRDTANAELRPLFEASGLRFAADTDHFNGGLYIFSPHVHSSIFEDARRMDAATPNRHWAVHEEGCVSLAAIRSGYAIKRLPMEFNRVGGPSRERWVPAMECFIQHYAGRDGRREERMERTIWKLDSNAV
jgi:hypothetical protein